MKADVPMLSAIIKAEMHLCPQSTDLYPYWSWSVVSAFLTALPPLATLLVNLGTMLLARRPKESYR